MRRVTFFNHKGGSGKTTSAVSVAGELAGNGQRVLLVDLDGQASASSWIGERSETTATVEVLAGTRPLAEAVAASRFPGVDLLPGGPALEVAEAQLRGHPFPQAALADVLAATQEWDWVVIDPPPQRGLLAVMSLAAASEVVVTVSASGLDLLALRSALELIDLVAERVNPGLQVVGTIVTRYDARTRLAADVREQLAGRVSADAWVEIVPHAVKAAEAPMARAPLGEYAPLSPPTLAYRTITARLLGKEER